MKSNTQASKTHLNNALRSLPQDFALTEVRQLLNAAINKIEYVERKRAKRELKKTPHEEWQGAISNGIANPFNAQQTLDTLDNMLAEENAKLEAIRKRKTESSAENNLIQD